MLSIEKKIVTHLTKCYCILPFQYQGYRRYLVASEKQFPCIMLDTAGNVLEEIWAEPGGTMSMVYIPGTDGKFLASHKMYSPNDSKEAKIVLVEPPQSPGPWKITTLVELPHVHRFDLLTRNGRQYLIACTICSGRDYKDDWSYPGKVYAACLPAGFPDNCPLPLQMQELKSGLLKNHGYSRVEENGVVSALITCENGVYVFTPPASAGDSWEIRTLLEEPVSDALLLDLDHDGQKELITLAPFHGDFVAVYHNTPQGYKKVYQLEQEFLFGHAICAAHLGGLDCVVLGARKGARDLIRLYYGGPGQGDYRYDCIDHDVGSANVMYDVVNGQDILLSANREIDEIAYYIIK